MQAAPLPLSRLMLNWLDRQPDRVCWPLGLALGTVPSLGMLLVSPTAGAVTLGVTLGVAVWLGLTGDPIALPLTRVPEPLEMIELPGGEFWMGSPESESGRYDNEARHRVAVSAFAMAKYPVTQKLYEEVMNQSPSYFKGESLPVESVSWFDAVRFCNKLSEQVGLKPCYHITESPPKQANDAKESTEALLKVEWDPTADGYRLPTEAEWEYACRAGTETAYSFGNDPAELGQYAWFQGNSQTQTHEVETKKPNRWGLHDLHGNVWEWCWDWYANYPVTSGNDKSVILTGPVGPLTGFGRVLRGGSFGDEPRDLRSASRDGLEPEDQVGFFGFRCVRGSGRQHAVTL